MPFLRRLYFPLLLLLIALYAFRPLEGGDDFWAHAAIGRIVLETGHIPKRTVYLWSADIPWVFQEYGAGVIYAALLRIGGPWLCLWLNFALAAIPFALVWRRAKQIAGEVPSALVVLLVTAIYFSQVRWHLRPEGFTMVFLTLALLFLTARERRAWMFAAIAGMFALWPSLHAGVLLGVLAMWVGAFAHLFDWKRDADLERAAPMKELADSSEELASATIFPTTPNIPRPAVWPLFALAFVCSLLPLLCNPWGISYLRVFTGTQAIASHVAEWRPFWAFPYMSREAAWGLCVLWVLTFGIWLLDAKRRATVLGMLLLTGILWLKARRQLWLTSLTCALALAQSAKVLAGDALYSRVKRKSARLDVPMRIIGQVGVLFVLIAACYQAASKKSWRAIDPTAPIAMSEFLATRAPRGRIYNDYEYSAALEWFLRGRREIYIDLINAYPPALFDEWFEIAGATPKGLKVLDAKRIDLVALRPVSTTDKDDTVFNIFGHINKSPDWKLIYSGTDGHVWVRRHPLGKAGDAGY